MKYYSIFDVKIGEYEHLFPQKTRGEAIRGWIKIVNQEKTKYNEHPEDFTLFEIGEMDEKTGCFKNNAHGPESLGVALEFLKANQQATPIRNVV